MVWSNTLNVYRRLIKLAKALPDKTRDSSLAQIRAAFRDSKTLSDPKEITALVEKANSTLGYLKMITPKSAQSNSQTGKTTVVFGEAKAKPGRAVTNWTGSNMDPDSVKRHQHTLKRAGFKDNSHAKGIF